VTLLVERGTCYKITGSCRICSQIIRLRTLFYSTEANPDPSAFFPIVDGFWSWNGEYICLAVLPSIDVDETPNTV